MYSAIQAGSRFFMVWGLLLVSWNPGLLNAHNGIGPAKAKAILESHLDQGAEFIARASEEIASFETPNAHRN